jgi:hypothetical protein
LIQEVDRICISDNNSYALKDKTARINQALDRYAYLSLMADAKWQADDAGATDLPIGTTNLVSGQQDYAFASDVLVVNKVLVKNSSGNWREIYPVDVAETQTSVYASNTWTLPTNDSGTPYTYDKVGNSILLNPIPNYNSTAGLKVVFGRNLTKFVSTDTTATPGIPSIFHPYLALYAAYPFLRDKGKTNARDIQMEILKTEEAIQEFYNRRERDVPNKITFRTRSSR